jgi:hypothetical protein
LGEVMAWTFRLGILGQTSRNLDGRLPPLSARPQRE